MRKASSTNLRNERWLLEQCPFSVTLAALGPRWGAAVLWKLLHGETSFTALTLALPLISEKVLAQELQRLQTLELVERHIRSQRPLRVEYIPSERARSLLPVLTAMQTWGATQQAAAPAPEAIPERQRLAEQDGRPRIA